MLTYKELIAGIAPRKLRKMRRRAAKAGMPFHHWMYVQHFEAIKGSLVLPQRTAEYTEGGIRYLVEPTAIAGRTDKGVPVITIKMLGYLKPTAPTESPTALFMLFQEGSTSLARCDSLKPVRPPALTYNLQQLIQYQIREWELLGDKPKAEPWKKLQEMLLPKVVNPTDGPRTA